MDREIINNIKVLGIDMIHEAGSGHPGIVLGAAPIIYTLYAKHLNINLNDPNWINRDRFVMSAGHGSALLYATLYMAGFPLTIDDLKQFRKLGSKTPGHPEYGVTTGVDVSTGPLGQGIATAVGLALGDKILEQKYFLNRKGNFGKTTKEWVFDHHVYCLCGDGDLMEGIASEAASFAGTYRLDNLIVLYDSNHISLDGDTNFSFHENVLDRFKAYGWHTDLVSDGNNVKEIDKAIEKAKTEKRPSIIEIRTTIGDGSLLAGTNTVHGKPLEPEDILQLKQKLGWSTKPFIVSERAVNNFRRQIQEHSKAKYEEWAKEYREFVNNNLGGNTSELDYLFKRDKQIDILKMPSSVIQGDKEELRVTNQKVMDEIALNLSYFIGGSADLRSSTKAYLSKKKDITRDDYTGSNIWFGVREHAMGAILNGLALCNFKVFGSTFLAFSDYLKPAVRMSALMKLPVTYIFTHDSISIGSDGPTHQPIEQLAMLRSTPNLYVYRPCDENELIGAWNDILSLKETPSALVVTKNAVPVLATSSRVDVAKGAYTILPEKNQLHGILIATGSEVHTAINVAEQLYREQKLDLRVVSMPCMERFLEQSQEYQEFILPTGVRKIVIEAGSSFGWHRFVYNDKYLITVDQFGASGSKDEVLKYCQFDFHKIKQRVLQILK